MPDQILNESPIPVYRFDMMNLLSILSGLAITLLLIFPGMDEDDILILTNLKGEEVHPLDVAGKKGVVLFFISPYCPTSNTFALYMKEISEDYAADFTFYSVHSDPSVSDQDQAQHATMMEITHGVLKDGEQTLAKLLGATITPEVFVVDADGSTLYEGRINDLYLGPTQKQKEVTTHDLRDALAAIRKGEPVPVAKTDAIGCKL